MMCMFLCIVHQNSEPRHFWFRMTSRTGLACGPWSVDNYSAWLCHNATKNLCLLALAVSQCNGEVDLPGDPVVDGHFRAFRRSESSGKGMVLASTSTQARSAHARILAHACTQARRHSRTYDHISSCASARPKDARSGVLTPSPTNACLLPHHSRARPPTPTCVCRCPHVYAALELTMTHAADASRHVACQYAGAASSACCVGKCTHWRVRSRRPATRSAAVCVGGHGSVT